MKHQRPLQGNSSHSSYEPTAQTDDSLEWTEASVVSASSSSFENHWIPFEDYKLLPDNSSDSNYEPTPQKLDSLEWTEASAEHTDYEHSTSLNTRTLEKSEKAKKGMGTMGKPRPNYSKTAAHMARVNPAPQVQLYGSCSDSSDDRPLNQRRNPDADYRLKIQSSHKGKEQYNPKPARGQGKTRASPPAYSDSSDEQPLRQRRNPDDDYRLKIQSSKKGKGRYDPEPLQTQANRALFRKPQQPPRIKKNKRKKRGGKHGSQSSQSTGSSDGDLVDDSSDYSNVSRVSKPCFYPIRVEDIQKYMEISHRKYKSAHKYLKKALYDRMDKFLNHPNDERRETYDSLCFSKLRGVRFDKLQAAFYEEYPEFKKAEDDWAFLLMAQRITQDHLSHERGRALFEKCKEEAVSACLLIHADKYKQMMFNLAKKVGKPIRPIRREEVPPRDIVQAFELPYLGLRSGVNSKKIELPGNSEARKLLRRYRERVEAAEFANTQRESFAVPFPNALIPDGRYPAPTNSPKKRPSKNMPRSEYMKTSGMNNNAKKRKSLARKDDDLPRTPPVSSKRLPRNPPVPSKRLPRNPPVSPPASPNGNDDELPGRSTPPANVDFLNYRKKPRNFVAEVTVDVARQDQIEERATRNMKLPELATRSVTTRIESVHTNVKNITIERQPHVDQLRSINRADSGDKVTSNGRTRKLLTHPTEFDVNLVKGTRSTRTLRRGEQTMLNTLQSDTLIEHLGVRHLRDRNQQATVKNRSSSVLAVPSHDQDNPPPPVNPTHVLCKFREPGTRKIVGTCIWKKDCDTYFSQPITPEMALITPQTVRKQFYATTPSSAISSLYMRYEACEDQNALSPVTTKYIYLIDKDIAWPVDCLEV